MKKTLLVVGLIILIYTSAWAQEVKVSRLSSSIQGGLEVQQLRISQGQSAIGGMVILPREHTALAPIVISHRIARFDQKTVDILPLAYSLARAGSAVLVLDRTFDWPVQDEGRIRSHGATLMAAERWLLGNFEVDLKRFAYIGPRFSNPATGQLYRFTRDDGVQRGVWVPIAEKENPLDTESLTSLEGQLKVAQWLQNELGLAPISSLN